MINEETTELDRFLSKEYQLKKYQDLKKLKGVEFNERMKLEIALRDTKNIRAINYLITVYEQKKDDNELEMNQSFNELLKVAQNITFFSLNISDMEFYEHELISNDLREIFKYLINRNLENNKKNTTNYIYKKINDNLYEKIYNDYEHYFYTNKIIDNFEIENSYFYDSLPYYEENGYYEENLEKKIEGNPKKYYQDTSIKFKNNNIFVNNINLAINLAMPEAELVDIIKALSKSYKRGEITKSMVQEETNESGFSKISNKYLTEPENFSKILFIYDMHNNKNVNKNVDKLFKAISKEFRKSDNVKEELLKISDNVKEELLKISQLCDNVKEGLSKVSELSDNVKEELSEISQLSENVKKELSKVSELSPKRIRDLSTNFGKLFTKQCYLEL